MKILSPPCHVKQVTLTLICSLFLLLFSEANAQAISGTKTVGPSSADYASLSGAFADLVTNGINGNVILELQSGYLSTVETFPMIVVEIPGVNKNRTVTIRPETGATNLSITSNSANTVYLWAAKYIYFDGRPGGVIGANPELTIANTSTSGRSVYLTSDASYNTFRYCTITGITASITSGVITLGAATTNGNDSNLIEYCTLNAGASNPAYLIYSAGSTTNTNMYNSHNQVKNCSMLNFGGALAEAGAIKLNGGNTDWTISNNHIFQSVPVPGTITQVVYGINLNATANNTGNNHLITNNYIGGSAPFCGGTAWTNNSTGLCSFRGIDLNVGSATPATVWNNIINNFNWSSASGQAANYGIWSGIWITGGVADIRQNMIGSFSGSDSIVISSTVTGSVTYGIGCHSTTSGIFNINSNYIGAIRANGLTADIGAGVNGIFIGGTPAATSTFNITNNKIGNDIPNNIIAANAATSIQVAIGINNSSSATNTALFNITGNKIQNLHNNHAGTTAGQTIGIRSSGGINMISADTVINITNASPQTGITLNTGLTGIMLTSTAAQNQLIYQNLIYGLTNTNTSAAAVQVSGIYYAATSATENNIISNNLIHSLTANSTNAASSIIGIDVLNGKASFQGNMIRLGLNKLGGSILTGYTFKGINETGTGLNHFYHNSVYIGGSNIVQVSNTYAFFSGVSPSAARNIYNNILVNERSDVGSGASSNYAVSYATLTNNLSNGNIFHTPGTSGKMGMLGATSYTLFSDWVKQTGVLDGASIYASPNFVNPAGDSISVNMHIQSPTPAERNGVPVPTVSTDFDGDIRGTVSPVDIGADAGNFTGADAAAPSILYNDLPNTFSVLDTLLVATIADGTGMHTTGTLRPKLYFKKTGVSSYASVPGTLISGTGKEGQWQFSLTGSLLGSFNTGDTIQYFIIAQDSAGIPNISSIPAVVSASSVNNISTPPLSPKSYRILAPMQGTRTIGTGGSYPNLSKAFEDLSLNGLSGPLKLELLASYSSANEVFPLVIPPIQGNSSTNVITIVPQTGATGLSISSATSVTVDLNGARFVTFDGRVGGTGAANLTIENTSLSGIAVRFINDAVSNTLTYCKLKGVNNTITSGVVVFSTTTGTTGNDNNTVSYCDITSGATPAAIGIYGAGAGAALATSNSDNSITNNTLHDIWRTTTESAFIKFAASTGGQRWTITNNSFFQTQVMTSTGTNHSQAIVVLAGDEHTISGNYIGGSQPLCAGSPWTLSVTTAARFTGMNLQFDTLGSFVENNVIANFNWQSAATTAPTTGGIWTGIYLGSTGVAAIRNNTIGSLTSNNSIVVSATATGSFALGILSVSGTKGTIIISNNKIGGFTTNTDATTKACNFTGIYAGGSSTPDALGLTYHVDSNTIGGNLPENIIAQQKASVVQVVVGIQNSVAKYSALGPRLAIGAESVPVPSVNNVYFKARNNTIQNLVNKHSGTTIGQTIGIRTTTGVNMITQNKIFNLWNKSPQESGGIDVSVAGIVQSCAAIDLQNISGNTVYNLFNDTAGNAAAGVTGIAFSGIASGTNTVSGNFIHHLQTLSTNNVSSITGLHAILGNANYFNNMVSLGADTAGAGLPDFTFYGIREDSGVSNYYHNSIHIGQALSSGISNTYAFYSNSSSAKARSIQNNIFSNLRLASAGAGIHYCISIKSNSNLAMNRNIYYPGLGGNNALGRFGANSYVLFSLWQAATNLDKASAAYTSNFIAPDASSSLVDLHIQGTTPVEAGGVLIPEVTTDIDGDLRDTLSPVDIGADAGNFSVVDLLPPSVGHTKLSNTGDTTNRIIVAQINDATGVSVLGSAPRMYYRTGSTPSFVSIRGTLVSGTPKNGRWEFVMDGSLLTTGINRGDSVYYFFMAQDSTPSNNIASFPDGADASDVTVVNSPPATLYSYKLLSPMSGTYEVGVGNIMQNLTDTNGAFAYMLTNGIIGDVVLSITSDLAESGTYEFPVTNYKIKIVPSSNTVRNIVGNNGTLPLIRLKGVRNITIDGRYNGAGRFLRFYNSNINKPTIAFLNDATRDTITYCIIEGGNTSSYTIGGTELIGVIAFNAATTTGNDSNCISYCYITPGSGQTPSFLVTSTGPNTIGKENSENSIIYNEFVNQGVYGLQLAAGTGANWDISYNSFYRTTPTTGLQYAMQIYNGDAYRISNNNFGGSAPDRSGAPYQTSSNMYAINIQTTASLNVMSNITGNKMSNIVITGPNQICQAFVISGGKVNISGNTIGGGAMPYDSIITGGINQNDIIQVTGTGTEINVTNNTIGNIYYFGTNSVRLAAINVFSGTSTGTIKNNTIRDIYSSTASTADYTVGISLTAGNNYTVANNTIYNLVSTHTAVSTLTAGIHVIGGNNHSVLRNRIYDIKTMGTGIELSAPQVFGVRVATTGNATVANNQISLGYTAVNESRVYGIFDASTSGSNKYYYNSVFINGAMIGNNNSYGFFRNSVPDIDVRNNIFYNKRTSSGGGKGYALAIANTASFTEKSLNYNLAITSDTAILAEIPVTVNNGWSNLLALQSTTNPTNWTELAANVPAHFLFIDTLTGNLNIDAANDASWYVNGKGIRIAGISGDFAAETGVRSESLLNGATDIGSDEINTTTLPPFASPAPDGNIINHSFGGRTILSTRWSSTGIPPSSVTVRYYSGVNPPNATLGKTRMNAYWDLTATGGSGYTFELSLLQDSAVMGSVSSFPDIRIARYNAPDWTSYPSVSNTVRGTFTSTNLPPTFGVFTGTDGSNNPLPVKLLSFNGNRAGKDVVLTWTTTQETNLNYFIVEYSADAKNWNEAGKLKANGNVKSVTHYTLTDANAFAKANTLFYRLKTIDNNSASEYSAVISVSSNQQELQAITVYPNPFSDRLTITLNSGNDGTASISMMDITGRSVNMPITEVLRKGDNTLHINTDNLELGIYFLTIEINGMKQLVKVIRN